MNLNRTIDQFGNRFSGSIPIIGIGASILLRSGRIEAEEKEDTAYRSFMKSIGAKPYIGYDNEQCCRRVIYGEITGHIIALIMGILLFIYIFNLRRAFFATWLIAFVADWAGGRIAGLIHRRMQKPFVDAATHDIFYGNPEENEV